MTDPTREAAFDLLAAVLDRRRPLEEALDALPAAVAPRDRAAAHRLAAAVLRRHGHAGRGAGAVSAPAPPEPVRHVLRLGAAGLLLLETPPHAAVATAVALTRARGLAPFAGLVNAVLRRVADRRAGGAGGARRPAAGHAGLAVGSWGADGARHRRGAPARGAARPDAAPRHAAAARRRGCCRPARCGFRPGTHPDAMPGFDQGVLWVQDAAAALPARLLAARPGERVADLCAAPGGKTGQLAAAGAEVTAVERDPPRLQRLARQSAPLAAGSRRWCRPTPPPGRRPAPFDAVLLDAPCSATGTIRRHPDVPRIKRPRDVQSADRGAGQAAARRRRAAAPGRAADLRGVLVAAGGGRAARRRRVARGGLRHDPFTPARAGRLCRRRARRTASCAPIPGCGRTWAAWMASLPHG